MHRQQVATGLDGPGHRALLLGREARVFAREDLAGVGDVTAEVLGRGKGNLLGREALLLLFGAHGGKKRAERWLSPPACQRAFFQFASPANRSCLKA